MNQRTQIKGILVLIVILCAVLMIGTIWGVYLFDNAVPAQTETTASSSVSENTSSSSSQNTDDDVKPKKMIAITFDDGPNGTYTHQILDLLEQYGAKATFFVCGYQLKESTKDELQRAIALGCEIGNHTATHGSALTSLTKTPEALVKELREANEKIAELSGTDYQCAVYRPPYGEINRTVAEILTENGIYMYSVHWNSDSRDWEYRKNYSDGKITREEAVQGTFETVVREVSEGSVVLMHDIQSITPDVVALILEKYTAEGYTFVTVSELFGFGEMQDNEAYYQRYHAANRIVAMS